MLNFKNLFIAMTLIFSAGALVGCDNNDGRGEEIGEKFDDAVDKTRDSVDDAADEVSDAAEDACEGVSDENC